MALVEGLKLTVGFSAIGIAGSLLLGVFVACAGVAQATAVRKICAVYIEFARNIPITVKLFFLYFVLGLDAATSAVTALIVHQSGYIADIVQAGIRSVALEQFEAGYSQGFGKFSNFTTIILPQVFAVVMPPLTSQFIEVVKNSAALMLIGIQELTFQTQHIEHETLRGFEAATAVTVIYLLIALAIAGGMSALGRRFRST